MVFKKCPGQDLSQKRLEDVVCNLPCPKCGSEVEFFFDDKNRICPECGFKVSKSDVQLLRDLVVPTGVKPLKNASDQRFTHS